MVTTRSIIANNWEKIHLTQSMDDFLAMGSKRSFNEGNCRFKRKLVDVTIWIPRWANYLCSAAWKISSLLNLLCYQLKRIGSHSEGRIPPPKIVFAAIFEPFERVASSQWGPLYMHLMKTKKWKLNIYWVSLMKRILIEHTQGLHSKLLHAFTTYWRR